MKLQVLVENQMLFERGAHRDGVVPDLAEQRFSPNDVLELGQIADRIANTSSSGLSKPAIAASAVLDDNDLVTVRTVHARYLQEKMMSPSSWDTAWSKHEHQPARTGRVRPAGPAVTPCTATTTIFPSPPSATLDLASFLVVSDDESDGERDRDAVDQIKAELSEESGGEMDLEKDLAPGFAVKLEFGEDSTAPAAAAAAAVANPVPVVPPARSKLAGKPGRSNPKGGRKAAGPGVRSGTATAKPKKKNAGAAGKHLVVASCHTSAIDASLPVVAFDTSGVLPKDHKPARGRGRHLQLQTMTKAQIEAESVARQEKNRLAARECRVRRKNHVYGLQDQVAALEKKQRQSQAVIAKLRAKIALFEKANKNPALRQA